MVHRMLGLLEAMSLSLHYMCDVVHGSVSFVVLSWAGLSEELAIASEGTTAECLNALVSGEAK